MMINEAEGLFLLFLSRPHFDIDAIKENKDDNRLKVIYELNNININDNNKSEDDLKAD